MPTVAVAGFVGPTNVQSSVTIDASLTVNWPVELVGAGTPKVSASHQPRPGYDAWIGLSAGPVRGMAANNGRWFAVGGGVFHELFVTQTAQPIGSVAIDGNPAYLATNGTAGHQWMITSGGKGYIFDLITNTLAQITDTSFPDIVTQVLFFDGFFIVLTPNGTCFLSSLEDGSTWNALDFFAVNQFSDTVVAMSKTHDNLWLYGTQTTSPFYNSGQPISPYIPIPGSLIEHGILAPASALEIDNTTYWLAQDEHGRLGIASGQGYIPVKISNPAIDYKLSQSQTLSQSIAYGYQRGANLFYNLLVPDLNTTIVYNIATKQFHEEGHWITNPPPGRFIPTLARSHVFFNGEHYVGSRLNRVIYRLDPTLGADRLVWS